jgi:hypothetical protein
MQEPLDSARQNPIEQGYLKKSAWLYKVYVIAITLFIVVSILSSQFVTERTMPALVFLTSLPIVTLLVLAPMGLFYSIKSYQQKEGLASTRFLHAFGHVLFCLLIALSIGIFISDINSLFV